MILCCGEALIDMLPRTLDDGEDSFMPVPGGAILNTAVALGRIGENSGFFSSISDDMFGNELIEFLHASNVDTTFCKRLPNPTTLAFVKLFNGQAKYSFFDENSALRSLEASQIPIISSLVSTLHFGAISLIPEPCGTAYETMMAVNQDKVISLDPNIRPSFIKDKDAHRARINRMIAMADIVKVSVEDLDWIANGNSHEKTIASWLNRATKIVVLTKDADGATAFTSSGSISQQALNIDIVDTIGAGDTFNAGFLAGLRECNLLTKSRVASLGPKELRPALELATKVAGLTVSKAGAKPPWRSEL